MTEQGQCHPLFIPLKSLHYDRFAEGVKTKEYRRYGKRWNERTCRVGRAVVLSRGYGTQDRLHGRIDGFGKIRARQLDGHSQRALMDLFGHEEIDSMVIACISVADLQPVRSKP